MAWTGGRSPSGSKRGSRVLPGRGGFLLHQQAQVGAEGTLQGPNCCHVCGPAVTALPPAPAARRPSAPLPPCTLAIRGRDVLPCSSLPLACPAACPAGAHQPACYPVRRFRQLSRLPTAVPDTALLSQQFERFLGLRDVFCIREFLSGWWVLARPAPGGCPPRSRMRPAPVHMPGRCACALRLQQSVGAWCNCTDASRTAACRPAGVPTWRSRTCRPALAPPPRRRRFMGAPADSIRRGNVEEFVAYGFHCRLLGQLDEAQRAQIERFVDDVRPRGR